MTVAFVESPASSNMLRTTVVSLEGLDSDSWRAAILYDIKVSEIGHHLRSLLKAVDEANAQGRVLGLAPVENGLLKPLSYPVSGARCSKEDRAHQSENAPELCDLPHPEHLGREHGSHAVVEPPATVRDWLASYADFLFDLHT